MAFLKHRVQKLMALVLFGLTCLLLPDILLTLRTASGQTFCVRTDPVRKEVDERTTSFNMSFCDVSENQNTRKNIAETCNPKEFIAKLNEILAGAKSDVPLHLLRRCGHVFYNRVPKCGSRSLYDTFLNLGERKGFAIQRKAMGLGRDPSTRLYKLKAYVEKLENETGCNIIAKHIYFINFPSLSRRPIVMINVLRDPLEQLISVYSWKRYGDAVTDVQNRANGLTMTLDDCITTSNTSDSCFHWHMLSFPFVCQQSEGCWDKNEPTRKQLEYAKWHLERSFLLVGVTEDLKAFLEVLEILMPQLFSGAVQVYEENKEEFLTKYKSKRKERISPETEQLIRHRLRYHYELYNYAKKRFYQIHQLLVGQKCK